MIKETEPGQFRKRSVLLPPVLEWKVNVQGLGEEVTQEFRAIFHRDIRRFPTRLPNKVGDQGADFGADVEVVLGQATLIPRVTS